LDVGISTPARRALNGVRQILLAALLTSSSLTLGQTLTETQLSAIRFDQKLNSRISLDLQFRDEQGKTVALADYFGQKPVVLVLGYYECPMLCTLTFNGMVESMNEMKWSIGDQFSIVHVSINPTETPALALAKKRSYLRAYGRSGAEAGWHFLTGDEPAIRQLANEVGFHYAYDSSVRQYAHPSGLIVLTPDGTISKYLFGVQFLPSDVYGALQSASQRKVGSPIEKLVLLCFHYNPIRGKYGALIMTTVRVLGAATVGGLVWLFVAMIRGERRARRNAPAVALSVVSQFEHRVAPHPGPLPQGEGEHSGSHLCSRDSVNIESGRTVHPLIKRTATGLTRQLRKMTSSPQPSPPEEERGRSVVSTAAEMHTKSRERFLPLLLWRRGLGRGGHFVRLIISSTPVHPEEQGPGEREQRGQL
jgi:protein SCO1/2